MLARVRAALATLPVLPFRTWFNRWFRSISDHVTRVGDDVKQVVLRARDDVAVEVRASLDDTTGRVESRLDRLVADVRSEANGVTEVAVATERRLARLEASVGALLDELDPAANAIADGPWVHRALAALADATVVLPGGTSRLAAELESGGHRVVSVAPDGAADLVVLRDVPGAELDSVLDTAKRSLAPGGRVVLALPAPAPDKDLDGWAVLDERYVARRDGRWVEVDAGAAQRALYVLG